MFQLCLAIGCAHPDFLLQKLNRRQLVEWIAYHNHTPFGAERDDFRAALQTFWLRHAAGTIEDVGQPRDYMPQFGQPAQTEAQKIADEILKSL